MLLVLCLLAWLTHRLLQVLDWELQRQLVPYMKDMVPLPGIYDPDYIAANQDQRADSLIKGSKHEQMETVREQIREFKQSTGVDKVRRERLPGCDDHSCLAACCVLCLASGCKAMQTAMAAAGTWEVTIDKRQGPCQTSGPSLNLGRQHILQRP